MICASCGRESHKPGCSICYRELAATSREWAEENIILHKQVRELQAEVERLLAALIEIAAYPGSDEPEAVQTANETLKRTASLTQGADRGADSQTAVSKTAVLSDT